LEIFHKIIYGNTVGLGAVLPQGYLNVLFHDAFDGFISIPLCEVLHLHTERNNYIVNK